MQIKCKCNCKYIFLFISLAGKAGWAGKAWPQSSFFFCLFKINFHILTEYYIFLYICMYLKIVHYHATPLNIT